MSSTAISVPMPAVPRRRRSPEEVAAAAPVNGAKRVLLAARADTVPGLTGP